MRVALVHEWIVNFTGSERVLKALTEVYSKAPIYTSVYNPEAAPQFGNQIVNTSFIQKIPGGLKFYQYFFPLMPLAMESFDLDSYDLVISNTHSCAKGVITNPDTCHICYCHTPTRYLWEPWLDRRAQGGLAKKAILSYMRLWDREAADRPDFFIANSRNIAGKIEKYYLRPSKVVYPPVNTDLFEPSGQSPKDYFLIITRLTKQKRVDLAIKAFLKLKKPLKIIGLGPEMKRLKKLAQGEDRIEFLGYQPDNILRDYYQRCQAFIFPQEEDFGITPLEAMACGRPIIAYGRGGALETVIEGQTGLFFREQTVDSLAEAVEGFDSNRFDPKIARQQALKFSKTTFKDRFKETVERLYQEWQEKGRS